MPALKFKDRPLVETTREHGAEAGGQADLSTVVSTLQHLYVISYNRLLSTNSSQHHVLYSSRRQPGMLAVY
jgi:hypothetical protein